MEPIRPELTMDDLYRYLGASGANAMWWGEKLRRCTMTALQLPPIRFTPDELTKAWELWGCNCGPTSLAVVLGISLEAAHEVLPAFDERRYTNPKMMLAALKALGTKFEHRWSRDSGVDWPSFGLARIQWDGLWCRGGVPIAARYRHSHWVACATNEIGDRGIFDCNCPYWIAFDKWDRVLVPHILQETEPKANGKWWVTNAIEVKS